VFAAGTLSVAFTGCDNARQTLFFQVETSLGKGWFAFFIEAVKNIFGIFGDIGAVFEESAGGHNVVCCDFISAFEQDATLEVVRQRRGGFRYDDGGTSHDHGC